MSSSSNEIYDPRQKTSYTFEGSKWAYAEAVTGRIFTIQSRLVHPETGEVLFTEEKIDEIIQRKGVKASSWIIHEKDTYVEADLKVDKSAVLGEKKPAHFHAVERRSSAATIGQVARAWGVPPNFVRIPKGAHSFADSCLYLTHEHPKQVSQGKHVYERSEVTSYGHDFAETVDQRLANFEDSLDGLKADELVALVLDGKLTPLQARKQDPLTYVTCMSRIDQARDKYLLNAPLPSRRLNFYFYGASDVGKSALGYLFAQYLAREYYPDLEESDAIHTATSSESALQNYRGQPIIFWDDFRAKSLIRALSPNMEREAAFSAFDLIPRRGEFNKKYGSVSLLNAFNIVGGVDPYTKFCDELAGKFERPDGTMAEAEDDTQSYKRFPFFTEVTESQIIYMASAGFMEGTRAYKGMQILGKVQASVKNIMSRASELPQEEKEAFYEQVGVALTSRLFSAADEKLKAPPVGLAGRELALEVLAGVSVVDDVDPDEQRFESLTREMKRQADFVHAKLDLMQEVLSGYPPIGEKARHDPLTNRDKNRMVTAKREIQSAVKSHSQLAEKLVKLEAFRRHLYPVFFGLSASVFGDPRIRIVDAHWDSFTGAKVTGFSDGAPVYLGECFYRADFDAVEGTFRGYSALYDGSFSGSPIEVCTLRKVKERVENLPAVYRPDLCQAVCFNPTQELELVSGF